MWQRYLFNNTFLFRSFWWPWILIILLVEIVLKGIALYRSARSGQKYWFVAILVINTVGILPLIYLICFRNRKSVGKLTTANSARFKRKKMTVDFQVSPAFIPLNYRRPNFQNSFKPRTNNDAEKT